MLTEVSDESQSAISRILCCKTFTVYICKGGDCAGWGRHGTHTGIDGAYFVSSPFCGFLVSRPDSHIIVIQGLTALGADKVMVI